MPKRYWNSQGDTGGKGWVRDDESAFLLREAQLRKSTGHNDRDSKNQLAHFVTAPDISFFQPCPTRGSLHRSGAS
jgi:hypothetical protein